MFKTIDEALNFIESQRMKRSFKEFQEIIKRYHLPVDLKNVIHVAGTNGKGSTVTFIKDLLVKQGYHVGTFTSPYIIKHNERISVDGKHIPDEELLRLVNDLYPKIEKEIPLCKIASFLNVTPETISHIRKKIVKNS